jgi:hypothetical protein
MILHKPNVPLRVNTLAQPDLARLAAMFASYGCSIDGADYDSTEPEAVGDGEACWFNYSVLDTFTRLPYPLREYHIVLATALPGYIGNIDSPRALGALLGFMKRMAIKHFREIVEGNSAFGKGAQENPYLDCYCLCDIGWDYATNVGSAFDQAMSDVQGQIGTEAFNQFGPLPLDRLREEYSSSEEFREICAGSFGTYHRIALVLDQRQRWRVIHLELEGIADLGDRGNSKDAFVVDVVLDSKTFDEWRSGFEELVNTASTREADIQRFFEREVAPLNPLGTDLRAYSQIVLRERGRTMLAPDFLLEPIACGSTAVLDIGLPSERLALTPKDRERFYVKLYRHIVRMRECGAYFSSLANRRWFRDKYGFESFEPELALIIGKDYGQWDYELLQSPQRSIYPTRLPVYTEILELHGNLC